MRAQKWFAYNELGSNVFVCSKMNSEAYERIGESHLHGKKNKIFSRKINLSLPATVQNSDSLSTMLEVETSN